MSVGCESSCVCLCLALAAATRPPTASAQLAVALLKTNLLLVLVLSLAAEQFSFCCDLCNARCNFAFSFLQTPVGFFRIAPVRTVLVHTASFNVVERTREEFSDSPSR